MRMAAMSSSKNTERLVNTNVPYIQSAHRISRMELYSFYILFKALSVVSSQIRNPDNGYTTNGVKYDIWKKGIFQLNMMSDDMAKKVYFKIDQSMEGLLDWEEFLKGMQLLNAKTKLEMITLFINLADSHQNGHLSFEELTQISQMTLKRFLKSTDSAFFNSLAKYFAKFIFESCQVPLNQPLKLELIKELIQNVSLISF